MADALRADSVSAAALAAELDSVDPLDGAEAGTGGQREVGMAVLPPRGGGAP